MNGEQNFKEFVIEQFYEVCMSFQDDPYKFKKETTEIGQELAKIKKLHVDKEEIIAILLTACKLCTRKLLRRLIIR